jgi:4-hydroxythreonine-4-phosphate dehydrogenase
MGDPAGIGGETILKALPDLCRTTIPVIIGDRTVTETLAHRILKGAYAPFMGAGEGRPGDAEFLDMGLITDVEFGVTRASYGEASYRYLTEALKRLFLGEVSALVTCPISKASIRLAGIPFTGHTELLAHFGGVTSYVMMMANRDLRVSLATIHISLRDVPTALSVQSIFETISITYRCLRDDFGIQKPYIKVSGLNPHAGEKGIMGDEEKLIQEAVERARSCKMRVDGPFPADTLFHQRDCDAFVAMYHDQGLIPVKTIDFKRTVNITLGLPFVRTSPGHGTGFDIAGKGIADPTGLIEAYRMAEKMTSHLQ